MKNTRHIFQDELDEINYENFDISLVNDRDMFDYIYIHSPKTIKDYIDFLNTIDQRLDYHPEGNVYNHTKAVTNRIAKSNDINLIIAAFLHDTGKDRTTQIKDGIIMQPGHEKYSTELLNIGSPWRDWVRNLGGDPNVVRFIISNHMKMKNLSNNNKNKKWFDNLKNKLKEYLNIFNRHDYGGHFGD
jgi:tRNA nucleotidyltransferase (CCA-adding enzyme)